MSKHSYCYLSSVTFEFWISATSSYHLDSAVDQLWVHISNLTIHVIRNPNPTPNPEIFPEPSKKKNTLTLTANPNPPLIYYQVISNFRARDYPPIRSTYCQFSSVIGFHCKFPSAADGVSNVDCPAACESRATWGWCVFLWLPTAGCD